MKEWEKVICSRDRVSWRSKGKNMCPHPQNSMQTQREKKEVENKTGNLDLVSKQCQPECKKISEKNGYRANSGALSICPCPKHSRDFSKDMKGATGTETLAFSKAISVTC